MTIYYTGQLASDFGVGAPVVESSDTNKFDPTWVANAIWVQGNAVVDMGTSLTDGWLHWEMTGTLQPTTYVVFTLNDSAGVGRLRLKFTGSSTYTYEYYNGSAWVTLTPIIASGFNVKSRWDIKFTFTTTGSIELYKDGILIGAVTGNLSNMINIRQMSFTPYNGADYYSQFIFADEPTINLRYKMNLPTSAGALADFTGVYTSVDEAVLDPVDTMTSATPGQYATFKAAARVFTGYAIKLVIVKAAVKRGVGGPQNFQIGLRSGGINYFATNITPYYGVFGHSRVFLTNPATGSAWTAAAAGDADLEFGVLSVA